jgi:hypothetical protein
VRGFVVSVMTSPFGTAFINFGREFPNETFSGFISAGSKMADDERVATLQGKIIGITGTIEFQICPAASGPALAIRQDLLL